MLCQQISKKLELHNHVGFTSDSIGVMNRKRTIHKKYAGVGRPTFARQAPPKIISFHRELNSESSISYRANPHKKYKFCFKKKTRFLPKTLFS